MNLQHINNSVDINNKTQKVNSKLLLIGIISIFLGIIILISWLTGGESWLLVLTFLVSLILCAVPLFRWHTDPSPVSPVYITVIYLIIAYHIKYYYFILETEYVQNYYQNILQDSYIVTQVFGMLILGMATYLVGFYFPPTFVIRWIACWKLPLPKGYDPAWTRRILLVGLIGLASLIIQFSFGFWSSFAGTGENWDSRFNQIFAYLLNYFWFAVIGSLLWVFSRQKKELPGILSSFFILACALFLFLFVLGSKTWIISFVLWIIMTIYMNKRRITSMRIVFALAVVIVFAFILVPDYRDRYWERYGQTSTRINAYVNIGVETLSALRINDAILSKSFGNLVSRFAGIDNAAMVISRIPAYFDYRYFVDFAYIIFGVLPRFLVPFKPTSDLGTWYSYVLVGAGAAAAPHPIAEGYINLGWVGVMIFFWFWGVYQALWYRGFYLPRKHSPAAAMLYAYFLIEFVGFGGWITGSLLRLPSQIISLIPLLIILNFGRKVIKVASEKYSV